MALIVGQGLAIPVGKSQCLTFSEKASMGAAGLIHRRCCLASKDVQ
jgi:hypothetical protein